MIFRWRDVSNATFFINKYMKLPYIYFEPLYTQLQYIQYSVVQEGMLQYIQVNFLSYPVDVLHESGLFGFYYNFFWLPKMYYRNPDIYFRLIFWSCDSLFSKRSFWKTLCDDKLSFKTLNHKSRSRTS